jgi:calcyphosin
MRTDSEQGITRSHRINILCYVVANAQPPMSKARTNLIMQAFRKLDRDHSGELTVDDLRGVYNGKKHPKYLNGQWTEDQVLAEWLRSFTGPGKTFDGVVS